MKTKVKKIAENPKLREAVHSMKPTRTIWGFLGVVLFFIVPEVIAFLWGGEITQLATQALAHADSAALKAYYNALIFLFEDGGSWVNLGIGIGFLVWLFR